MFEHVLVALDALLEDRPELAPPLGLAFLVARRPSHMSRPREPHRTLMVEEGESLEYGETWIHPVAGEEDCYSYTLTTIEQEDLTDEASTATVAVLDRFDVLFGTLAETDCQYHLLGVYAMRWTWTRLNDRWRLWPTLTADEIVSVQPMTAPVPANWIIPMEDDGD
jgi:hypothetical protein